MWTAASGRPVSQQRSYISRTTPPRVRLARREESVWGPWGQESRWMRLFCPVSAGALRLRVTDISFCFNRRKTSRGKCHPVFSFERWRKEITHTKVSLGE